MTEEPYQELERSWAKWNGLDPTGMVVCSSGTAALHLALESLRLPPHSEVILSTFNMIACARAVVMAGLTPIFVDCDEKGLMDIREVEKHTGEETRAVIATHIYGRQCDISSLVRLVNRFDLSLVEDLAEAHCIAVHVRTDAACWSFYRNKVVAGEEGGAVWVYSSQEAVRLRQLRSLGFTHEHDFQHVPRGHNYRLANSLATLILKSLGQVAQNIQKRRELERLYNGWCPPEYRLHIREVPWVYDLCIPDQTREQQTQLVKDIQAIGVAARHGFYPMHLQEEFVQVERERGGKDFRERYPVAERLSREVIYLPVNPDDLGNPKRLESMGKAFELIREVVGK